VNAPLALNLVSRRRACSALVAWSAAFSVPSAHGQPALGHSGLRTPHSLATDLSLALAGKQPLIAMVSLDRCPFCKSVRDSHLLPLQAETGQVIVQVDMKSSQMLADFNGQSVTHDQLIRRWGAKVAPTVLFLGGRRGGCPTARRRVPAGLLWCLSGGSLATGSAIAQVMIPVRAEAYWKGVSDCRSCGIRDMALFADLNEQDFGLIHAPIDDLHFSVHGVLFHEDEAAPGILTIRHGAVKLVRNTQDGRERVVRVLRPGDVAGLEAIATGRYGTEAVALSDTDVCRIPLAVIHRLDAESPSCTVV
jgi:hypothetical protein